MKEGHKVLLTVIGMMLVFPWILAGGCKYIMFIGDTIGLTP